MSAPSQYIPKLNSDYILALTSDMQDFASSIFQVLEDRQLF